MTPLFVTVGVLALYRLMVFLSGRLGHPVLANPTLWSAVVVLIALAAAEESVSTFLAASAPLALALELAVVALALPLVGAVRALPSPRWPVIAALLAGAVTAMGSAVALALLFGLPQALTQALGVKSVSSGFAIALMERLGGPAPLAAGLVVTTGVIGALLLPPLLRRFSFDSRASGLATGLAAHVVGTDALLRSWPEAGRFAVLAVSLGGVIGALLLPLLWPFLA
ncbi:MAG: LrgB family protein [Pacificimonas sp.]|jgi:putative effector of murein hydrolase|nr:LrgB family protein [Pacificimonas sp.]